MAPTYSLVIPVHNEEASLPMLYPRLRQLMEQLDGPSEVLFVDDGSRDASIEALQRIQAGDRRCKVIELSRNFGHQKAVSAGLDLATGDAVVVMDADGQDPPEVVLEMAARWREGFEIVYGVRQDRSSDTWFKRTSARAFYRLINRCASVDLPAEVGDFRLIDRKAVDAFKSMREKNRYVRGMFSWVGFRQTGVSYTRPERSVGETSYTLSKMLRLAEDGVLGFSQAPLRAIVAGGVITTGAGVGASVLLGGARLAGYDTPKGSQGAAGATTLAGLQLVAIGIVGQYVGRIFDEAVDRPLYVIRSTSGLEAIQRPTPLHDTVIDLETGRVELAEKTG